MFPLERMQLSKLFEQADEETVEPEQGKSPGSAGYYRNPGHHQQSRMLLFRHQLDLQEVAENPHGEADRSGKQVPVHEEMRLGLDGWTSPALGPSPSPAHGICCSCSPCRARPRSMPSLRQDEMAPLLKARGCRGLVRFDGQVRCAKADGRKENRQPGNRPTMWHKSHGHVERHSHSCDAASGRTTWLADLRRRCPTLKKPKKLHGFANKVLVCLQPHLAQRRGHVSHAFFLDDRCPPRLSHTWKLSPWHIMSRRLLGENQTARGTSQLFTSRILRPKQSWRLRRCKRVFTARRSSRPRQATPLTAGLASGIMDGKELGTTATRLSSTVAGSCSAMALRKTLQSLDWENCFKKNLGCLGQKGHEAKHVTHSLLV